MKLNGKGFLAACGAAVFGVLLVAGSSLAATEIALQVVDRAVPLAGAQVSIFLSDTMISGTADADGRINFSIERGNGFWVEVNGERLKQFFLVQDAPHSVDLSVVGTMPWRRK